MITLSLYDKIQTYKKGYVEKALLLEETTASQLATCIKVHTRGDKRTAFFDGEGGLCYLASNVSKLDIFKNISVLEKDMSLVNLHHYAKSNYLDHMVPIYEANLTKIAVDKLIEKLKYVSPLLDIFPTGEVSEDIPSFTLATTATHGFVKYLVSRMVHRNDPFGEFFASRPEFFLLMSARTYFHICCGIPSIKPVKHKLSEKDMRDIIKLVPRKYSLMMTYNVLFQIYFDFCLVDVVSKKSFFPWKSHTNYNKAPRLSEVRGFDKLYEDNHENMMVVYARPKTVEEVSISNPVYFEHFISRLLRTKGRRVVQLYEEWGSGWGYYVIQAGYTVMCQVDDMDLDDIRLLYDTLISIPDFEQSNFVAEANEMYKINYEQHVHSDLEMDQYRINFRRNMGGQNKIFEDVGVD